MKTKDKKPELWEKLRHKYEKYFYKDIYSFTDLLWKILMNEKYGDADKIALAPVEKNKPDALITIIDARLLKFQIAIVIKNIKGYSPTNVHFISKNYDECRKIINEINI